MIAGKSRRRISPFFVASVLLHVGVVAALARFALPAEDVGKDVKGLPILVTIIASAPSDAMPATGGERAPADTAIPEEAAPLPIGKPRRTPDAPVPVLTSPEPLLRAEGEEGEGVEAESLTTASLSGAPAQQGGPVGVVADDYLIRLHGWLSRHKDYPRRARARRDEGVVVLQFFVAADGRVTESRVDRTSGNALLDEAALAMLTRASPVPVPPDGPVSLVIPVEFQLR